MSLRSTTEPLDDGNDLDEAAASTARERIVRAVVLALLLVAATIAAYQQVWHAGYIWDDDVYVLHNPLLTAADGLKRIWFSLDSPSQYFPLVYTSFRFEHALWGLNPAGYHWVNIALHAVNALLLWRLLHALRIPGAWLAAALFALHPVQVESVAWISERKNVLMVFFYLLALLAWVAFVAGKRKGELKFYALALLCFALALFSKTTACTLPIALLLISWLKRGSISRQRLLQVVPFVVLGIAMGLVSIWWERFHQGTQGEIFSLGVPARVLVAARAFWFYLSKLAWPAQLAFSYPRWPISPADPMAYIWLGACVAFALAIWILRRWLGRGPEVALIFFAVTLAPTLGFVMLYTFRYTFVADHYQYLASIGPLALVAAAVTTATDPLGRAKYFVLPLICAVLLIPAGLRTWRQGAAYLNEEALWRATLAVNPGSWMAHNNLAIRLLSRGQVDEAITEFEKALSFDPNYAEAHYNLANALLRKGSIADARAHYEKAIELNPRIAMARTNLALILLQGNEVDQAVMQLEEAVKTEPRAALAHIRLSDALMRLGRADEALSHLQTAAEENPDIFDLQKQLASLYLARGNKNEAREHGLRAVQLNPNDAVAQINLGIALSESGSLSDAIEHFQKAVELDPQSAEAHYNLGNALRERVQYEEAIAQYRQAVELRPEYAGARMNLANVYMELDRTNEAVAEYEKALEIRPNYANAHRNLAIALHRLGRDDEATQHMETALRIDAETRGGSRTP